MQLYAVRSTSDIFRSIDILVNNAGIVYVKKLIDTSEDEWDKTIDINLKGSFLCTRAVLHFMTKNRSGVLERQDFQIYLHIVQVNLV